MNVLKLKLSLQETMEKWIETQGEDWAFDTTVIGDLTARCMAEAAFAVIEAMHEAQQYGLDNGHFSEDEEEE
jgi:hypothetical protein